MTKIEESTASVARRTSAKFVVAGGFGVGKTTFVGTISEIPPLRTEEHLTEAASEIDDVSVVKTKTSTTVAMDFGRINVGDSLMIYLFGTPGQLRFSFMWDTIVEGALGAVVLIDPRRLDESYGSLDYFEQRELPFVVVQNEFPDAPVLTQAELRDYLAIAPEIPVTTVDATDKESVKNAVTFLIDHLMQQLAKQGGRRKLRRKDLGR